jgi:lipopolysaccharide/colanic/teichoic acid biosynthesis glycosyltransferase
MSSIYRRIGKRILDITLVVLATPFVLPIIMVVAGAVRFSLGCPILFRQMRPGRHGKPFTMFKFRTMREAATVAGDALSDAERLTPLGRMLRSMSLDELPELYNVLRGEMSLVGPRPLLMDYLPLYSTEQKRRHDVLPGVTGWAQVSGRNELEWQKRFELDVWYVDNYSLALDLRILLLTMSKIVRREGVTQPGRATVDYFQGNLGQSDDS